ncbi:MAG: hypothetical protein LBJ23_00720 [Tannerella sp.]|jgi:cytochrome c biogenesis protein CcdA|nr:hypothetical protein [Tannerella sp.]
MKKKHLKTGDKIAGKTSHDEAAVLSFGAISVFTPLSLGTAVLSVYAMQLIVKQLIVNMQEAWPRPVYAILAVFALHVALGGITLGILSLCYGKASPRQTDGRHIVAGKRFAVLGIILGVGFLAGIILWIVNERIWIMN